MMRRKRQQKYKEGDWFAVRLPDDCYALGLLARLKGPVAFGYFFGPKRATIPTLADVVDLRPADAIARLQFGDLHLFEGRWPVLGQLLDWDRSRWPMPRFAKVDVISGQHRIVTYDDDNPGREISLVDAKPAETVGLPEDVLCGAGSVEIRLDQLLGQTSLAAQAPG